MQRFRYLRPAPEERRAQLVQIVGTFLALLMIVIAANRIADAGLRAMMHGIVIASVFLTSRSYAALERKKRRAERQEIALDETGICFVDQDRADRFISWRDIQTCEVRGGKLRLEWKEDAKNLSEEISAREVENGVPMIEAIARFWNAAHGRAQKLIIPLTPK